MGDESALTIERTHNLGAVDDAEGNSIRIKGDGTSQSVRVNLWTWDTSELAYVRQTFLDMAALATAIDNLTTAVAALTSAIEGM